MVEKKGSRRGRQGSAPGARRSHALFLAAAAPRALFSQWRSKRFNIAFCVSTLIRMHIVAESQQEHCCMHARNATSTAEQPQKTA